MELEFEEYCGYYLLKDFHLEEWYNVFQDVTTEAYDIFGEDILDRAYLRVTYGTNIEEVKTKIRNGVYRAQEHTGCIDVGGEEFIVVFKNGKCVWITNSEWGDVHSWDYEKYIRHI